MADSVVEPTDIEEEDYGYASIFVRTRESKFQFVKDRLDYPDREDAEHKDDPPARFQIHIQGFDEYGDPTCPVYKVKTCAEIQSAIHDDKTIDPKTKRTIASGRLVEVRQSMLKQLPLYIGQPTLDDDPDTIYDKVRRINAEKPKGDAIVGRVRPPFEKVFFRPDRSENDKILWERYQEAVAAHQ